MTHGQDAHERAEERKAERQADAQREPQVDEETNAQQSGGQVSSVTNLDDADRAISDDQAVAGQPEGESGDVDEGPTGPNSRAGSDKN